MSWLLPPVLGLLPTLLPSLRLNDDLLNDDLLMRKWFTPNVGLETVVGIGGIVNSSKEAVSIVELVRSLHGTIFSPFMLRVDVAGVMIVDCVVEVVICGCFGCDDFLYNHGLHMLDDCWLPDLGQAMPV